MTFDRQSKIDRLEEINSILDHLESGGDIVVKSCGAIEVVEAAHVLGHMANVCVVGSKLHPLAHVISGIAALVGLTTHFSVRATKAGLIEERNDIISAMR